MRFVLALIAGLGLPAVAMADQLYKCEMTAHSRYGWIAPVVLLALDDQARSAMVFDGIIKEAMGKPIPARVSRRDAKSLKLTWVVTGIALTNRRARVSAEYSAILRTGTGRLSIRVYLSGMDMDPPRGTGTCKPVK